MARKKKPLSLPVIFLSLILLVATCFGLIVLQEKLNPRKSSQTSSSRPLPSSLATLDRLEAMENVPSASAEDWELILVNPYNVKEELKPDLTEVNGIQVDSRIAEATQNFLAAAQVIDPGQNLVLGYRSLEELTQQYESYVQQEMAAQGISQEEAEKVVQTYAQPPGGSEHMTGLAIDMTSAYTVNQMPQSTVDQIEAIAADHGFVLRFKEAYTNQTGTGAEDWHYRYVGQGNARYMYTYGLSLEAYLDLLAKENSAPKEETKPNS